MLTLLYTLKKKTIFSPSVFMSPLFKVYKKVVEFSFTQQKIFWVLVFSFRIWYFVYTTDRLKNSKLDIPNADTTI